MPTHDNPFKDPGLLDPPLLVFLAAARCGIHLRTQLNTDLTSPDGLRHDKPLHWVP